MTSQGSYPRYRRWLAQAHADYQETEVLFPDPSDDSDDSGRLVAPARSELAELRQSWSDRSEVLRVTAAAWRLANEDSETHTVTTRSHISMPAAQPQRAREPKSLARGDVRQPGGPRSAGLTRGPAPGI